ncbi:Sfum_1244 family protein [Sulfuriflexus mobilis]|uniref:Sfum_1244 family protein n=1 Tax=Sulfuriflexus mobilis TaxID=1811807 RepID=UPI000F845F63|nr:Sfum_1244 family protein [Sulfuriflexus mobilis]
MFDVDTLRQRIQHNCHISDARYAGNYSICTFLLKMREYYRWEQAIPLSQQIAKDEVGPWLTARERAWDDLDEQEYAALHCCERQDIEPFDENTLNQGLLEQGYIYSSGQGLFGKPHFFLGKLAEYRRIDDIDVYIAANEVARDMVAPPAMLREQKIFIRQESLRRFIWEKIEENRWRKLEASPIIASARCYDVDITEQAIRPEQLEALLDAMTANETEVVLQHELGEAAAERLLGQKWKDGLNRIAGGRAEHLLRAVRDHQADSLTTLPWLLENENTPGLHFYFGNFTGLRKLLFPELLAAYEQWQKTGQLAPLQTITQQAAARWQDETQELLGLLAANDVQQAAQQIVERYREQLGPAA